MCCAPPPQSELEELEIGEITPAPPPITEQKTVSSKAREFRIKLARELARGFLAFVLALRNFSGNSETPVALKTRFSAIYV